MHQPVDISETIKATPRLMLMCNCIAHWFHSVALPSLYLPLLGVGGGKERVWVGSSSINELCYDIINFITSSLLRSLKSITSEHT